jgi:putative ABC transport system permease protein
LVVFQFVIAQAFIISTLIVLSQMNYFKNAPLGFEKEAIVSVPVARDSLSRTKFDALKQKLLAQAGIKAISYSAFLPIDQNHWETQFRFNNQTERTKFNADIKMSDADFAKAFGIPVVAGRFYFPSDTVREIVVNESLVKELGFRDPNEILGKPIAFNEPEMSGPVVGVVKDFHNYTMDKAIAPTILTSWKQIYQRMNIRIDQDKARQLLPIIEKEWSAAFPDYVYEYEFLDEKINNYYKQEDLLSKLYFIFACIAVFISCLGIYGLISFLTSTRIKEIGIRKVLGASQGSIIFIFSKEIGVLILIAFAIAGPIAYYFMSEWLQRFTYRIDLSIWIFLAAIAGSLLIGFFTVGYKTFLASSVNPVKSIRSE